MKYTRSKDGIDRANLRATVRVDREELAEFRQLAAAEGYGTLGAFLNDCLRDGVFAAKIRRDDDKRLERISNET